MVRKYKEQKILCQYNFPNGTYEELDADGIKRILKYEWIVNIPNKNSYCIVIRNAIPKWMTIELYKECQRDCILQIKNKIYNNEYLQPRLNCVYSDINITKQKYSNTEVPTIPWTPLMDYLRNYVTRDGFKPNSALCNGYLSPDHFVDYHKDRGLKDGRDLVSTVSLGGSRIFSFMEIETNELLPPILLNDGDLVFFWGGINTLFKHSILKPLYGTDSRPRYSITFRTIDIQ